jgi:hypothetical protein
LEPSKGKGTKADEAPSKQSGDGVPPAVMKAALAEARRDSGGGAKQFEIKGGDNSIQEFGGEAEDSEREEAAVVLHAFLKAEATRDLDTVCSLFAHSVRNQLQVLASHSDKLKGKDCPTVFDAVTAALPPAAQKELIEADVGSLRTKASGPSSSTAVPTASTTR